MNKVYYGKAHCGTCQCPPIDVRIQKMYEFRVEFEALLKKLHPLARNLEDAQELAAKSGLPLELIEALYYRRPWS